MIWAYLAGVITLPLLVGVIALIGHLSSRTIGSGGCHVCEHIPQIAIGDQTMLAHYARTFWHRWFWSKRKWHREAWAAHRFNPQNRNRPYDH